MLFFAGEECVALELEGSASDSDGAGVKEGFASFTHVKAAIRHKKYSVTAVFLS